MAFCTACGTQLPDDARFCPACGAGNPASAAGSTQAATHQPMPPAPPRQPDAQPDAAPAATFADPVPGERRGGGAGWILPALIVGALLVIAIVMLMPKRGEEVGGAQAVRTAAGEGATGDVVGSAGGGVRTVDEADAAAGRAIETTREMSGTTMPTTSAAVLDSAFASDPDGAALRYPGPVRVSGVIASMVQPGPTPALSMEGRTRFNYMIVNFPVGYRERLAPLSKGQFISVRCGSVRSLAGTTILGDCDLD